MSSISGRRLQKNGPDAKSTGSAPTSRWPMVKLGQLLNRSDETVQIEAETEYRQITVKLWGKGVVERGRVLGAEVAGARRFVARRSQFILSRIDARNGAVGLVPNELDGAIVTNDFPVFNVDRSRLLPSFLEWMSRTPDFVDLCRRASEGTTNRVRLQEERFLETKIPLPSLSQQQRIVQRLNDVTAEIVHFLGLRSGASSTAEQVLERWLATAMAPGREGWRRYEVSDVIISMDAGWSPRCHDVPARGGIWGVLKTTAVQWCEFRPEENKALPSALDPIAILTVQKDDVLVTRAGPRQRVGVVARVLRDEPRLTISDKLIRLRADRTVVEPHFLELAIASPGSQEFLVQRKTGLADAQVNISQAILRATPIAIPSLGRQRRIVAAFDELQKEIGKLRSLQSTVASDLNALLPSILDRAFKGQL